MAKNLNCKNCRHWDENEKHLVPVNNKKVLFRICRSPSMAVSKSLLLMKGNMSEETKVISIGQNPVLTHAKFYCNLHVKK